MHCITVHYMLTGHWSSREAVNSFVWAEAAAELLGVSLEQQRTRQQRCRFAGSQAARVPASAQEGEDVNFRPRWRVHVTRLEGLAG